ncbi:hypothetical protein [Streptomyces sp. NPDC005078]|uniref:hypothetical protein n=1 Tax=unclassified Streptomyces TaxID=2593676 RepID=UPI0033B21909
MPVSKRFNDLDTAHFGSAAPGCADHRTCRGVPAASSTSVPADLPSLALSGELPLAALGFTA